MHKKATDYTTQSTEIPDTKYVVTNYETVVRKLPELLTQHWDAIIVDEATVIKNKGTRAKPVKRTAAIHKLTRNTKYLWLLTGTPIHNNPGEIWSLLHAINPKYWSSYWKFIEQYCVTEIDYFGYTKITGVKNKEQLAKLLAPVMIRRTKELLNLPALSEETITLRMEGAQHKAYCQMEKHFAVEQGNTVITVPTALAQITRLRQISCSPQLLGLTGQSAKTQALMDLLEELAPEHKVLVFSSFAQYVKELLPQLKEYNPVAIIGEMSAEERNKSQNSLQHDRNCRVLLGTMGAMSEGLNLQEADVVIFTDLAWTPALNDQAIGRAYRRGQAKPVHVYKLIAVNSVDEDILGLLNKKLDMIRDIDAVEHIVKHMILRQKGGDN